MICRTNRDHCGAVLLITLALLALITIVVVAYFSRATTNRRIESATAAAVEADILARAAAQIALSDVKSEIIGGSTAIGSPPLYRPTTPQQMIPYRVLAQTAMSTNPIFDNLVKQSTAAFFSGSGYSGTPLINGASPIDTSVVSANNRIVSLARWNAPVLNSGAGFSANNQLPHWIIVDRQGIAANQSTWSTSYRDYTPGNSSAIVGRFAFNVYDVGGLLDANVAAYPVFSTQLTDATIQQLKSTQGGASLYNRTSLNSIVPGFDATFQTNFVNNWRFSTNSSANFMTDFMSRATNPTYADSGFMRPTVRTPTSASSQSNTMAYSRQDLIRLSQASSAYLSPTSLPYLSHFSRELNAPSWTPTQDASSLGGSNGGGTYAYLANKDSPSAINRDVLNVRVKTAFTRTDGTQAVIGEPLIKNRFALRRIDSIGNTGVNTTGIPVMVAGVLVNPSATTVQRDFGLVWNSANNRWDYVGPTGATVQTSIATLDQIATANREPNFLELLKAFILSGSVGLGTDNTGTGRTFVDAETRYYQRPLSNDAQIIQIGANIIDQWDADKNPTFIFFGGSEFAGQENLPLLSKIGFQPRWTSTTAFTAFLVPSFWTTLQNATAINTTTTSATATTPIVRFVMTTGTASAVVEGNGGAISAQSASVSGSATQPSVNLTNGTSFGSPDAASSSTSVKLGMVTNGNSRLGIQFTFTAMNGVIRSNTYRSYPILNSVTFEMQAQIGSSTGPWKTYQRWVGCNANTAGVTAAFRPAAGFDWTVATVFDPEFVLLDPRTMRFGAWETDGNSTGDSADFNRGWNETLDRGTGTGNFEKVTGMGPQGSSFSGVGPEMANNTSTSPNYKDLDGVRRTGDALTNSSSTSAILPSNSMDRSPLLSRQTRMVAELGTVFRDQPWKTLNFTTPDSGDAGLLDAFSIFEPNSVFRSDIVAGKVSLNTRQAPLLRSVLDGIATNTNSSTPLITEAQRDAVVAALLSLTSTQPMINKTELVSRLAADPAVTGLGNKETREAVIRALSDVGQTRTWNLMIDVIAQIGKYSATASALENFIVQGEKRYWLHVAIDRFTGEVIDQQLEAVYE